MKKLKLFLALDKEMQKLLVESFFYLGWARYQKRIPFSKVAPSLGTAMGETSFVPNPGHKKQLSSVSQAIAIISRYTFWESQCLVRAIAGMKMLEKRNIESTLYLGTAKDENGEMIAHAWLRSGSFYISGSEEMSRFTVVAQFAKEVGSKKLEGENYG